MEIAAHGPGAPMSEYFVKVIVPDRRHAPWLPRGAHYFCPVELRDGTLWSLCNREDYDNAWGFDTFEAAYKHVLDAEHRRDEAEHDCTGSGRGRGDREDFHADG